MNVCSLLPHFNELESFLHTLAYPWSLIVLSEVWSNKTQFSSKIFPGYSFLLKTRPGRGGGVGLLISDLLAFEEFAINLPGSESIAISFTSLNTRFFLIAVYRSPSFNLHEFVASLSDLLGRIAGKYSILIVGDINIDLLSLSPTHDYSSLLIDFSLYSLTVFPTRLSLRSSTLIDHILTDNTSFEAKSGTITPEFADHRASFAVLYGTTPQDPAIGTHPISPKISGEYSPALLRGALAQVDWITVYLSADANAAMNLFIRILGGVTWRFVEFEPRGRHTSHDRFKKPWINWSIMTTIDHVHRLHREWITAPSIETLKSWHNARKFLRSSLSKAKKLYYSHKLKLLSDNPSRFWDTVNLLRGKPRSPAGLPTTLKLQDGRILYQESEIAKEMNFFFANAAQSAPPVADLVGLPNPPAHQCPPYTLPFCTPLDVVNLIHQLKDTGFDGLRCHPKFLKDGCAELAPVIAFLINRSIQEGIFPSLLKSARVIPIFKAGSRDEPGNYRPISILPLLSKLLEKFVDMHLRAHLDAHQLWAAEQYGFRAGHSTIMPLVRLMEKIMEAFANRKICLGIFLDIKKAFDSVDHLCLLSKLPSFGITGSLLCWFESYLCNRTQFIDCTSGASPHELIRAGVPQGSILGPTLFSLYINDLPLVFHKLMPSLFADDTSLFQFSNDLTTALRDAQDDLRQVEAWMRSNRLSLNVNKSAVLVFASPMLAHKRPDLARPPELYYHRDVLITPKSAKFLGVILTCSLNWDEHVRLVCKKIAPFTGFFWTVRQFAPLSLLVQLYNSLVLPHLSYALVVWGSCNPSATYLLPLQRLQKRLVRIMTFSHPSAASAPLFQRTQILPIHLLCNYHLSTLAFSLLQRPSLTSKYGTDQLLPARHVHGHNTRFSASGSIHEVRGMHYANKCNVKHHALLCWNALPKPLRDLPSIGAFKKNLKGHLLQAL
eukprot:Pompholyxophrys_punicea_v1_NODE_29_length_5159_cov_28.459444.p1 type:complete len:946 gc:universal NODE_29_length_5159_cov_28.459444:3022-185(-)